MEIIALILVFFVYGLAFFTLGVVLFLESGRNTALGDGDNLKILASFAILHGIHEWIDMLMILSSFFSMFLHVELLWVRIIFLVASFFILTLFGIRVLVSDRNDMNLRKISPYVLIGFYFFSLVVSGATPWNLPFDWFGLADLLARFVLAVPGAVLAAIAFRFQANQQPNEDIELRKTLSRIGLWFAIYAVTQIVGPTANMYALIASENVANIIGIAIPASRGLVAILIAVDIIRATQFSEIFRQLQEKQSQEEKVFALEQAAQALGHRNQLRREFIHQMIDVQENERARISRELHDETAQLSTALSANLAALNAALPPSFSQVKLLRRMSALINDLALNIHRLVHELRPAQLDELGLEPAIEYLLEHSKNSLGLIINKDVNIQSEQLDAVVETVVYRAAQEALNNVFRHAKTLNVEFKLVQSKAGLMLEVVDDGIGFNQHENITHDGFGLAGMQERVHMVDGILRVESVEGEGTRLTIEVPVIENYEDNEDEDGSN